MTGLVIGLVVWACFGALPAAWLAGEKGRSALPWFLIGLLLGPIAIITVGFAPAVGPPSGPGGRWAGPSWPAQDG